MGMDEWRVRAVKMLEVLGYGGLVGTGLGSFRRRFV